MLGISSVYEQLLASQEGLPSMQLVLKAKSSTGISSLSILYPVLFIFLFPSTFHSSLPTSISFFNPLFLPLLVHQNPKWKETVKPDKTYTARV
jgi:hypothetical protein